MPKLNRIKTNFDNISLNNFFNDEFKQVFFPFHIGMERTPFYEFNREISVMHFLIRYMPAYKKTETQKFYRNRKEKNKKRQRTKHKFSNPALQSSLRCQTHAFLPPHTFVQFDRIVLKENSILVN